MQKFIGALMALFTSVVIQAADIAENAESVRPILVGQTIPDVVFWQADGKPVKARALAATKPSIVVFYRGGWCPYCNTQLQQLKDIEPQLQALGYQLIAVSPELPDTLRTMEQERKLGYQLISDYRLEAAKAFGIAFRVDPAYAKMAEEKVNAKLQKYAGETLYTLPVPAVFVLDTDGVVQFQYVNPNYRVRLHSELLLTAARLARQASK
ncbi:peroxiredoxin-like family protein [Permianibacter aggregans]|uniref:thioredoxin-dependent peroxiredoxin n=1 Tax=Permianibacter aggregans TaxID=1510150 RepID=A0A4R6UVK7_9GAMM|nr:peroxiredoxin-like family protein [Permianibacter aggregans]QGX40386.1 AhpC/TSA family protein [Permianibacter aggregans]TDQ49485.1 peroxiredoxin [Permianibacter aggregans]